MKKIFTQNFLKTGLGRSYKKLLFAGSLIFSLSSNAQVSVLVPSTGSNSIPCGQTSFLQDHAGSGTYQNNCNGYTVIEAGFASQITLVGTCSVEVSFDYIRIYDGVGTGGTLLQTYNANPGNINYTGAAGQTLTVQFTSDGSVTYDGFDINVTFNGPCSNIPCTSTPGANTVMSPTYAICPNSAAALSLANSYTVGGITFQWQSSTVSPVGPWSAITTATSNAYSAPNQTTSTYYSAVITCTNTNGSYTTAATQVTVSPVIIDNVPYYESFEGIGITNKLPNCSWSASNLPNNCQTYTASNTNGRVARTGSSFASFYYNPGGTRYFYTNGINLNAGVTYSAALWFQTEYYGSNNWTDLSIMYGTTQTTTGLVTIASTNGPAISNVYKSLSNTFVVPTSGVYYIVVKAVGTTNSSAQYLTWDDLSVTIPCSSSSPNTPTLSLVTSTTSICAGETVNLNISGADTYTWNNGSNASGLSETPQNTELYSVIGTNTLTGCTSTVNQLVVVNTPPALITMANPVTVCSGEPSVIQVVGGTTYTWSTGGSGSFLTVNPTAPATYTVLSMGANGCVGSSAVSIGVNSLPNITVSTDRPSEMCPTEVAVLTAVGSGVSYQWLSNVSPVVLVGNPVNVSPSATSIYTVTATDVNGCKNSSTVVQPVIDCTSLTERTILSNLNVFPNPTSGEFSIETTNTLTKSIEVIDITGKVVYTTASDSDVVKFNLKDIANGVYYVKIQSNNSVEVVKVVKQ
jgi:hypothetical protein